MAQPIHCDGPDDDMATFMVTNIDEADTRGFCLTCMADFALAYLTAIAPDRLQPAPKPPARPRKPKAPPAAVNGTGGSDSDAPEPAPRPRPPARKRAGSGHTGH